MTTGPPEPLVRRYAAEHLDVFTADELRRYADLRDVKAARAGDARAWDRVAEALAWELLYRVEPELYERLVAGERLHPGILDWLPARVGRAVEVAAGTGRLTVDLGPRCAELVAVEPAEPLRRILVRKLAERGLDHVEARSGFFDELPVDDGWAELVVTCSAFTPEEGHGGPAGLQELERVCAPGGLVVVVWPAGVEWLVARGYTHESFPGEMHVEFASAREAVELARIFYPEAAEEIAERSSARVPFDLLGVNAPRDLAWKRR